MCLEVRPLGVGELYSCVNVEYVHVPPQEGDGPQRSLESSYICRSMKHLFPFLEFDRRWLVKPKPIEAVHIEWVPAPLRFYDKLHKPSK